MRRFPLKGEDGEFVCHSGKRRQFGVRLVCASVFLTLCVPLAAGASSMVTIQITTQPATALASGFSGFNVPQPRNGVEYYDPKFVTAVTPLAGGWMRFPGGTTSMAYDWSTGEINVDWMNSLIQGDPAAVTGQPASILTTSQQLTQAKGGVFLSDFATFANTLKNWAIICFNSFTDTNPGSATQMAVAAHSYGLHVEEWELGNEAYLYPLIYSTAGAYATASSSYFNNVKAATPAAPVGLFAAGWYTGAAHCSPPPQPCFASWDQGLWQASPPPYWNAASNHIYPISANGNATKTIQALNGILAYGSTDYINSYLIPLVGANTPIFITELNCCTQPGNKFLSYLYNGIFLAEYIARLSSVPNVKGVGVDSLYTDNSDYHGLIQSVDDYESYLLGQLAKYGPNYSTNTATNPNTQFQFYTSAPGLAMQVANQAINNSARVWSTTVTGGPTVAISGFDGNPIPAVYAQGYLGKDGSTPYLLITNKSAEAQQVTIEVNGALVKGQLSITYVSNSSPTAANTASSQTNVQIQTMSSSNPFPLPKYTVTAVTW